MRFMMMVKSDAATEAGAMPSAEVLEAMGAFNEKMAKAGVLLEGEGLHASSDGAIVELCDGKLTVTDGPFGEAKELIAGYWLIRVGEKAEALEWARQVPGDFGEVEIRELYETADFPVDDSERSGGWRDQELAARETAETEPAPRKPGTARYLALLKSDRATESGELPRPEVLEKMGALMQDLVARGAMLGGEGLKPSATGARVVKKGGACRVVDGPFAESKEMVAGYITVQAASRDEVVELAKRWLEIHVEGAAADEGRIEIRHVFEIEEVAPGEEGEKLREREQALRDEIARRQAC